MSRLLARSLPLVVALALAATAVHGTANIQILNVDPPGQGFNDPTPATPLIGNPGTTLGQQRLNAFRAAAEMWGAILDSDVTIKIEASMPDLPCDANGAVLGQAGTESVFRDFAGAPRANTWYHSALADSLAGNDLEPGAPDVVAFFNALIDEQCLPGRTWYYGVGAAAPLNQFDFVTTVKHEIAHGIGFSPLINRQTGARLQNRNDIYMTFLEDHSRGQTWPQLTNQQRLASIVDTGDLHWVGPNVVAAGGSQTAGRHGSGHIRMFAPNPAIGGSSISHFDIEATPNELMEPNLTPDAADLMTTALLKDLGWNLERELTAPCVPGALLRTSSDGGSGGNVLCLADDRFEVTVTWAAQGDSDFGTAVPFTADSGLFYFFSPDNIEMLVKVLNVCIPALGNKFYVFFAATTDVEFRLRVRDTFTGAVREYFNPPKTIADAVTDTTAFDTCATKSAPLGSGPLLTRGDSTQPGSFDPMAAGAELERELAAIQAARSLLAGEIAAAERRAEVEVRPVDLSLVPVSRNLGPEGETYTIEPGIAADIDNDGFFDPFSLQQDAGDNNVTFDGVRENLKRYLQSLGLNTIPQVTESITDLGNGRARLVFTLTSNNGSDLFPGNFTSGPPQNVPLTDLALFIGFFQGNLPLVFQNSGVESATVTGHRNANQLFSTNLPVGAFFGNGPWDGNLAFSILNQAGRGINRLVLTLVVTGVPPDSGGPGEGQVDPFTCVPSDTVFCLNDGRFEVKVDFSANGQPGQGMTVPIPGSNTSGLYWFFSEDNLEMLIKVLDSCIPLFNRFWVFFAATTNVEFTVTVTDSETGFFKTYTNPSGLSAETILDTDAFATCP